MTMIAVSNSAMADYDVDDRVRSRMGTAAEVAFGAYTKEEVLRLLQLRAAKAAVQCAPGVLERCAQVCADEHGDARRALELLKCACELAGVQGQRQLFAEHVDLAAEKLQKDRIAAAMSGASYHLRIACSALVRVSYLTDEEWHSTSTLYDQYCLTIGKDARPLTYRRVSELLGELVSAGIATSATSSLGRGHGGYGTRYRLALSPELIGSTCFPKWWAGIAGMKDKHEKRMKASAQQRFEIAMGQSLKDEFYSRPRVLTMRNLEKAQDESWKEFVGLK